MNKLLRFYLLLGIFLFPLLSGIIGCGGSSTVPASSLPTVTLTANPSTVTVGQSSTLTWSSTGATTVTSSNFSASGINGSISVTPTQTTTYTITVQGPNGQKTVSVTVSLSQIPPQPLSNHPSGWFTTITSDYTFSYTSSTAPFSPEWQFSDSMYPITVAYSTNSLSYPADFSGIILETENAIRRWSTADPRVTIVSRVAAGQQIQVELVNAINYQGLSNIIGLTQIVSTTPTLQYLVSIALIDPVTNQPMSGADLRKTLTHELGHCLGLGHSPNDYDIMYYKSSTHQGSTNTTYLTLGDALTVWSALNSRQIQWISSRPAVQIATGAKTAQSLIKMTSATRYISDKDGPVICVYAKQQL